MSACNSKIPQVPKMLTELKERIASESTLKFLAKITKFLTDQVHNTVSHILLKPRM